MEHIILMNGTNNLPSATEKSPVIKALRLISHLANSSAPVPLAELSRALDLPRSTSHRLAQILEKAGFVNKDPITTNYSLGATFDDVALSGLRNGAGSSLRKKLMTELSEKLGVRANFTVLKAGKLFHVEWVDSTSVLRVDLKPDTKVPVHCSASGKLLLAYGPEHMREHVLRSAPFEALTKNTITSAAEMERELARIRQLGYAEDNEEFIPGVNCLAVPVKNSAGQVVAGLAMMAPRASFPLSEARRHLKDFMACAEAISSGLGWCPPDGAVQAGE